jgi:xanthine/uracil permease
MPPAPLPPQRPEPTTVRQDISPPVPIAFTAICVTGVVILALGAIYGATASLDDDWQTMQDTMVYGRIIMLLGAMLLSIGLLAAGFASKDMSPRNRSTLYMAGVIIMAIVLIWPSY